MNALSKNAFRLSSVILVLLSGYGFATMSTRSANAVTETHPTPTFSVRLKTTLTRPKEQIFDIVLSPDGKSLATVTREDKTELWNTETGKLIAKLNGRLFRPFDYSDFRIISGFSPDSRKVLTINGKQVKIWEAATGRLVNTLVGFNDEASSIAFSPDGKTIVTGGKYGTVSLWNLETGQSQLMFTAYSIKRYPRWRIFTRFFQLSTDIDVSFSPSGNSILTTLYDQPAKKWNAHTGQLEAVWGKEAFYARFSPGGRYVLTGSLEGTEMWDTESGMRKANFTAYAPAFSKDETWLGPVQYDGKKGLLNVAHMKVEVPLNFDENDFNSWLAFSPNGEFFIQASGLDQHSAKFVNASTGELIADVPIASKQGFDIISDYLSYTESLAFHPGSQVVMGANKKKVRFWEARSGKQIAELEEVREPAVFSNDGNLLAAASVDKKSILLWEVAFK